MGKKIGVVGIPGRWSSELLADRLEERTGFRLLLSSEDISLHLESQDGRANGRSLAELDGLIIKKIGPDYSHYILDRVEVLRTVHRQGLQMFPSPETIARAVNRLSCTAELRSAGVPIPETVITESVETAHRTVQEFGQAVFKPLFTSKARGMMVFEAGRTAHGEIKGYQEAGNPVMYIQKRVEIPGYDLGVVFLGGKHLATYARVGKEDSWNTTTVFGGRYAPHEPSPEVLAVARKAQSVFDLDFASVDIAETPNGPVVFEVSAFGGFRGLKETHGIDAAKLYADLVVDRVCEG